MYAIDVAPKAERQLKKIAKTDQQAYRDIRDGIKELRNWPAVTDIKALKQHTYGYRLRIGRYRVFFNVDKAVRIIKVKEVKKRDEHTY